MKCTGRSRGDRGHWTHPDHCTERATLCRHQKESQRTCGRPWPDSGARTSLWGTSLPSAQKSGTKGRGQLGALGRWASAGPGWAGGAPRGSPRRPKAAARRCFRSPATHPHPDGSCGWWVAPGPYSPTLGHTSLLPAGRRAQRAHTRQNRAHGSCDGLPGPRTSPGGQDSGFKPHLGSHTVCCRPECQGPLSRCSSPPHPPLWRGVLTSVGGPGADDIHSPRLCRPRPRNVVRGLRAECRSRGAAPPSRKDERVDH